LYLRRLFFKHLRASGFHRVSEMVAKSSGIATMFATTFWPGLGIAPRHPHHTNLHIAFPVVATFRTLPYGAALFATIELCRLSAGSRNRRYRCSCEL
jgi:hypothetical protein